MCYAKTINNTSSRGKTINHPKGAKKTLPIPQEWADPLYGLKVPPWPDETASLLGQPGHRTRPGRSGLDYIETESEFASMQGKLVRALFTGRLVTNNPFYLAAMLFMGIWCLPIVMVIVFIYEEVKDVFSHLDLFNLIAIGLVLAVIGIFSTIPFLLLFSFFKNMWRILRHRKNHKKERL